MMEIQDRVDQSLNNNRSEAMSAILTKMSEFFCPSDRELALRGQIKTGWSTAAARKKSRPSQMKLSPQEIKHIQHVVAQAETLQMAEEIRIGVQMLKLQRLRSSCRGNGTSSCVLCGYDFTNHRSRSPISMHFCHECAQAVCSRCKSEYKCHTGETVVLCRPCSDERELWKKSGAWLSNKLPVINVSEEQLEKVQQQRQVQKVVPLRDFMVSPSKLEDEDESEDDLSTVSGSTANYGGYPFPAGSAPSSRSPSPDLSFMSEANAAAAAWRSDRPSSTELHPLSNTAVPHQLNKMQAAPMMKSVSYDLVATRRQRSSTMPSRERNQNIVRKSAMSGDRKKDMEEMRRRAVEKKRALEQKKFQGSEPQRTPSPPTLSVGPLKMKRSRSNELTIMSATPHPHIKVVRATPPASPEMPRSEKQGSESPLTEKAVVSDPVHKTPEPIPTTTPSSTTHETPPVQLSKVPEDDAASARKRKPVPIPRKKPDPEPSSAPTSTTVHEAAEEPTHEPVEFKRITTSGTEGKKYSTLEREKKPTAIPVQEPAYEPVEFKRITTSGTEGKKYSTLEREKKPTATPVQEPAYEPVEFKRITTSGTEGKKYSTLEREKKPTATPRRRTGSFDKEKSKDYGSLERRQRGARTPEPQAFEFKKVAPSSRKAPIDSSKPSTVPPSLTAVLPADVSKELERELRMTKQAAPSEVSPSTKHEDIPTPKLKEIGKTTSVAHDVGVDSVKEHSEDTARTDSTGPGDHKWQRKGARRTARGRDRHAPPTSQADVDDDDQSPRPRARSRAVSGNSSAAAMRSHHHTEEEQESYSRSRTRSGAVSGSDAASLRRGRNMKKMSPSSAHRAVAGHSSGPPSDRDHDDFPEPRSEPNEPMNSRDDMYMHARVSHHRRAARTGGDLLVATDGQYGSIELTLEHFPEDQRLSVTIHSCRGLRGVDRHGLSDPYVRLFLAPSPKKDVIFKTLVLHRTLAPEYHQKFTFQEVSADSLEKISLIVAVINEPRDQPIGGINIPLYEVTPGKPTRIKKLLNEPEKVVKNVLEKTEVGKVELNFRYDPHSSILKVGINQATLLLPHSKSHPNSYVTGHLQTLGMSVNVKRKTRIVTHAALPRFDEVLEFSVESGQLYLTVLTISMWDHRKIAKDVFLGQVTLHGRKFWEEVKNSSHLSFKWYHLKEQQNSCHIPSPLYSTL